MFFTRGISRKKFSSQDNLQRHLKYVHGGDNRYNHVSPVVNCSTPMKSHFTCIVAGCTQSGKTVCVRKLAENAQKVISSPPHRIVWCYGQWRPMYLDMIATIPGFEFNEVIPKDILDVSELSLVVLDVLMAQSGKDNRISDLVTNESRRNLSVIYIVQNIFHRGRES